MNEIIERATDVAKTIAEALARPEPLSVAECNQLALLLNSEGLLAKVDQRLLDIKPGGAIRARTLEVGSVQEVLALKAEHETVQAIHDQMHVQMRRLLELRNAAGIRQAIQGLPSSLATLEQNLGAVEAAKAALDAAMRTLQTSYRDVYDARRLSKSEGRAPIGASAEIGQRIVALAASLSRTGVVGGGLFTRSVLEMVDDLGVEQPSANARNAA